MDDNEFYDQGSDEFQEPPTYDLSADPDTLPPPPAGDDTPLPPPPRTPEPPPAPKVEDMFGHRHREPLEGMLFLGRKSALSKHFGHQFVMRTLHTGEILQVAEHHRQWVGTVASERAYQVLALCFAIESVDGKTLPVRLDALGDPDLDARFEMVKQWYPPVLDALYSDYLVLEADVREVLEEMGKR